MRNPIFFFGDGGGLFLRKKKKDVNHLYEKERPHHSLDSINGIVLWLDAENVDGKNNTTLYDQAAIDQWTDLSGNGNNAELYGVILTKDRNGNDNAAYKFDGIDEIFKEDIDSSDAKKESKTSSKKIKKTKVLKKKSKKLRTLWVRRKKTKSNHL